MNRGRWVVDSSWAKRGVRSLAALSVVCTAAAVNADAALTSSKQPQPATYFPRSVLSKPIPADARLAPNSAELVSELRNQAFGVAPDAPFDCRHSLSVAP